MLWSFLSPRETSDKAKTHHTSSLPAPRGCDSLCVAGPTSPSGGYLRLEASPRLCCALGEARPHS